MRRCHVKEQKKMKNETDRSWGAGLGFNYYIVNLKVLSSNVGR
jgi:hypothetical protein